MDDYKLKNLSINFFPKRYQFAERIPIVLQTKSSYILYFPGMQYSNNYVHRNEVKWIIIVWCIINEVCSKDHGFQGFYDELLWV